MEEEGGRPADGRPGGGRHSTCILKAGRKEEEEGEGLLRRGDVWPTFPVSWEISAGQA